MAERSLIIPPLTQNGKNWLLVIGIDQYPDAGIPDLSNAVNDATAIADLLTERYGFATGQQTRLVNADATHAAMFKALKTLSDRVGPDDNVLIYFAGHGWYNRRDEIGYLIPVDAAAGAEETYFENSTLLARVRAIRSQHTFLVLDSCFSGSLLRDFEGGTRDRHLDKLAESPSRWALTAGRIEAVEDGFHGSNSPFAQAVLRFLDKEAPDAFAVSDLIQYVKRTVPNNANQLPHAGVLFRAGDLDGEMVLVQVRREAQDWEAAQAADSIAGYEAFVAAHPDSAHVREAQTRMAALREAAAWEQTRKKDTVVAYTQYLRQHADSEFAAAARARRDALEEEAAWKEVKHRDTLSGYEDFLRRFPASHYTDEANTRIDTRLREEEEKEKALADAEQRRSAALAEEKKKAEEAEQRRLAEEKRQAEAAEQQRLTQIAADKKAAEAREAEALAVAEQRRSEAAALAEEKRQAEVAEQQRLAKERQKAEGLEQQRLAQIEADRKAAEEARANQEEKVVSLPKANDLTPNPELGRPDVIGFQKPITSNSPESQPRSKRLLLIGTAAALLAVGLLVWLIPDWGGKRVLARKQAAEKHIADSIAGVKNDSVQKAKADSIAKFNTYPLPIQELIAGMVRIAGGTFDMGSKEGKPNEKPVHSVSVGSFSMSSTEVTQAQYKAVMGSNPSYFRGDNLPVDNVQWVYAQAFIKKLNQLTGKKYRLPTEAEWEYAAREGGKKVRFGNGKNTIDPSEVNFDARASYKKPYSVAGTYRSQTTPVKTFSPNALGLYDMSGNVFEWCQDWYYGGYYAQSSTSNPTGPTSGEYRILRGGSWVDLPQSCRTESRHYSPPDFGDGNFGFRLCL